MPPVLLEVGTVNYLSSCAFSSGLIVVLHSLVGGIGGVWIPCVVEGVLKWFQPPKISLPPPFRCMQGQEM